MVTKLFSEGIATVRHSPHLSVHKLDFIGFTPQFEKIRNETVVDITLTFVFLAGIVVRPQSFLWPLHQCYEISTLKTKISQLFFSFFFAS